MFKKNKEFFAMNSKFCILSVHGDDEMLSSFTYLLKSMRNEINLHIIYQAVNDDRIKIINKISEDFRFTYEIAFPGWDSKMDKLYMKDIISYYDNKINSFDEIIIPSKSFHQDHKICHDACIAALRRNNYSSILISEHPFHISYFTTDFVPNKYISFEDIDMKIKYLEMYKPYLKQEDINMVYSLNVFRGNQIGERYAESFQVVREISNE